MIHKTGLKMALLAGVLFGLFSLAMASYIDFDSPQIMLVDVTEKSSSGYKMFQIELTGMESAPNSVFVHFTNGIKSDKSNTAISFDRGNAIISVIYQEIPTEFSEFSDRLDLELKAVNIDGWFIPLDDAQCYGAYCSEFNLYGDTVEIPSMKTVLHITLIVSTVLASALTYYTYYDTEKRKLHIK